MDNLKRLFTENCFDNDIIIAHNLFIKENKSKIINFLKKHDNNLTKIFIDSIDNLEYQDYEQWRPIHYICCYSTPEMIKYIIDKGVDLECEINDRWRPIHYICRHSTPEMIKYIIDKGVDLECANINKWRPIHIICRNSTPEMIKYLVDCGVNLIVKNNQDKLPIDYINDEEMKAYVRVHMDYQLANTNELYMNGYQMAMRKLFSNSTKSARK